MSNYQLPPVTEQDLQRELDVFNDACCLFRESQQLVRDKKKGLWPMFSLEECQLSERQYFEDAYSKIPTLYQVELNELLNQKQISWM